MDSRLTMAGPTKRKRDKNSNIKIRQSQRSLAFDLRQSQRSLAFTLAPTPACEKMSSADGEQTPHYQHAWAASSEFNGIERTKPGNKQRNSHDNSTGITCCEQYIQSKITLLMAILARWQAAWPSQNARKGRFQSIVAKSHSYSSTANLRAMAYTCTQQLFTRYQRNHASSLTSDMVHQRRQIVTVYRISYRG